MGKSEWLMHCYAWYVGQTTPATVCSICLMHMMKAHMHTAYVYVCIYCEELIPCQGICSYSYFLNTLTPYLAFSSVYLQNF